MPGSSLAREKNGSRGRKSCSSRYVRVMSVDLHRRARLFRRGRFAVLALVIVYFFLPYWIQAAIPVWLLFLAALGLEVEFFLGGYRQARRGQPVASAPDGGPQQRDL